MEADLAALLAALRARFDTDFEPFLESADKGEAPSRRKGNTVNGSQRGKGLSSIGYDITLERFAPQ